MRQKKGVTKKVSNGFCHCRIHLPFSLITVFVQYVQYSMIQEVNDWNLQETLFVSKQEISIVRVD